MALIELENIRKTYALAGTEGVEVLKGVTLKINEGSLVALMGA